MGMHEQVIRRFRGDLLRKLTTFYALILISGWAFVWGTVVLISRAAIGTEPLPLLWGALGIVPAAMLAMELARRRLPEPAAVRAMLDRYSAAGGLLMAETEAEVGEWGGRLPRIVAPQTRFRTQRLWGVLAASAVFVAVGFAVPQRYVSINSFANLDVTEQTNQIEEQIEALKEEKIIDADRAEQLEEKLEQITADAKAEDPAKTLEAIDHMKDVLSQLAQEAAENALAQTEKLSETQSLAEGIKEDQLKQDPSMSPSLNSEAMNHLSDLLNQMQKNSQMFKEAMAMNKIDPSQLAPKEQKQMKQLFLSDKLDPKLIEQVKDAMDKMGINPKHAGLLKPEELKELQEALKDNNLSAPERDALRKKLEAHEMAKNELPELSDQQLKDLEKKLQELGLDPKDYALIPKDMAENLTSEKNKQLDKLADSVKPGMRFKQIYLDEALPLKRQVRARLAVLKIDFDRLTKDMDAKERLAAAAAWTLAESKIMEEIDKQLAAGADEAKLKAEIQKMASELPSEGLANKHFALIDAWSIDALRRATKDEFLEEWEMKQMEERFAPHQVPDSELPADLTREQLDDIEDALLDAGFVEEEFALMPPQDRLTDEQLKQMEQLAGACKDCKEGLAARLAKLSKMKLIDPKKLGDAQKAGEANGEGLSKFLAENAGSMSMQGMMRSWQESGRPGKGGITRGRGDAPLTWKDPTNEQGAGFKEEVLPASAFNQAKDSQLIGVSSSAPKVAEDKGPDAASALNGASAGGGSANKQAVLPRHRQAVERYFKRE
ncbi:MAG: hypothetical protein GC159_10770 [Phycisphaera sp.]|nr:hypothetical protein [Phycisphaera sp.]